MLGSHGAISSSCWIARASFDAQSLFNGCIGSKADSQTLVKKMPHNLPFNWSAHQRRWWVPVALRARRPVNGGVMWHK